MKNVILILCITLLLGLYGCDNGYKIGDKSVNVSINEGSVDIPYNTDDKEFYKLFDAKTIKSLIDESLSEAKYKMKIPRSFIPRSLTQSVRDSTITKLVYKNAGYQLKYTKYEIYSVVFYTAQNMYGTELDGIEFITTYRTVIEKRDLIPDNQVYPPILELELSDSIGSYMHYHPIIFNNQDEISHNHAIRYYGDMLFPEEINTVLLNLENGDKVNIKISDRSINGYWTPYDVLYTFDIGTINADAEYKLKQSPIISITLVNNYLSRRFEGENADYNMRTSVTMDIPSENMDYFQNMYKD